MSDLLQEYRDALATWKRLDAEHDSLADMATNAQRVATEAWVAAEKAESALRRAREAWEASIK